MFLIDSDNALGSWRGDIDDAFAISAVVRSGAKVLAISSVAGNCVEKASFENNVKLAGVLGYKGPILRGREGKRLYISEASRFLVECRTGSRVLALGPLSNIADAIRSDPNVVTKISEIIIVGSSLHSLGRWPPYYPKDFNLTKDRAATQTVLTSGVPITLVPLDVAGKFSIRFSDLDSLKDGPLNHLREQSRRWFWRTRLLKWTSRIPLWDLVAALYALDDEGFDVEMIPVTVHKNGWVQYRSGSRKCLVIKGLKPKELWERFLQLMM